MREPGYPPEDAKEAVDILTTLKWLSEADVMVGSELADKALNDAALLLWKSGLWTTSSVGPPSSIGHAHK